TGDGSLVSYPMSNACGCPQTLPLGVFSEVVSHDSLGLPRSPERDYPDGSIEVYGFNNFPIAEYLVNRLATDTVHFTVDSLLVTRPGRVRTISDPSRMNGSSHACTEGRYGAKVHLAKIGEPRGRDNMPDSGRVTTIAVSSSGLLTTWKDPDGDTTHFGYD